MAKPKVGPKEFLILNNMRDRKMPRITRQLFSQVKEFHRGPLSKFRKMTKKKEEEEKCVYVIGSKLQTLVPFHFVECWGEGKMKHYSF
jgi:hypothetical protein